MTSGSSRLITASSATVVAFALAIDLLAPHLTGLRSSLNFSTIVAWLIGQSMWVINYWNVSSYSAGIILLALFHIATTLIQQYLQSGGQITRRVLSELALVGVGTTSLVWLFEIGL